MKRADSVPTRRVELPLDGLRDRYTTVVLRGQNRAGDRSRTDLSLCGAQSCHLDAPAWRCRRSRHLGSRITVGATAAFGDSSRASGRIRTDVVAGPGDRWLRAEGAPLQSDFATDASRAGKHPARAGHWIRQRSSPTLWNRTRTSRASAERADRLRKSGLRAPHVVTSRDCLAIHPSVRRRSSSSFFGCQRSRCAGRTSGLAANAFAARAPRASVHTPLTRAHLSRFVIWIRYIESQNSDC